MLLQKIIVVIVGLVMSVVGALSPEGLLAGKNEGESNSFTANTADETLATLRTSDGQAFARVSVLWVEVDGRRVSEDAWATGEVDEIRFKVGVKDIADVALAVGDKIVPLHPTDIITIRMFDGDYSFRGLGTPLASVQLQGAVKTTVLNEGDTSNRVLTRINELELTGKNARPGDEAKVAYVVLTTGQKVDTVAVEDGGARIFTEEVATASEAKNEPGNLLAKWVKIDGKLIREYTWGDGMLPKVEFEPAEGASRSIVLAFNGETFEVPANERVVVEDFVGEYLIYQVSGGMMRVRLDGYARAYTTAPALPLPSQGGEGAPLVYFEFTPASPKTTDTVQFRDRTTDDGIPVFRQWDFGDNSSGILPDPTHRFSRPGTYDITLTVTDNDLKTSNLTRSIVIRNSEPVADFDFSPKIVNTDTLVAFTDHSYDADGTLVNWTWDYGDGTMGFQRHPVHRFVRAGNITVTLTVSDEMGGRSSLSKVILVRNSPPLASFTYSPGAPMTLDPVTFFDNSTDRDGRVVAWNWSFGDGRFGSGSNPVHAYARPGLYTVSLTAYDDMGDVDTASTTILVGNRPPFADFTWKPDGAPANEPITFTSQSTDPDGIVLFLRWNFGDGAPESQGPIVTHTFPHAGTYNVTLTATDNTLGVSTVVKSVSVANSAPRASMIFAPNPTYRGVDVTFSDTSVDPDGDTIVNSTWDFGDGAVEYGRVVRHSFANVNSYSITLTVKDENGQTSSIGRSLRVLNRPPTISVDHLPKKLHAGENVTFTATGIDPDLIGGSVDFTWNFSDGPSFTGPVVTRKFPFKGNYSVTVRGFDTEGGISAPIVLGLSVDYAKPIAEFTWTPTIPNKNQIVNFSSDASSANGAISAWRWSFGDNSPIATLPNPPHVYTKNGTFTVRLEVTDVTGQTNFTTKTLTVNLLPNVVFTAPTENLALNVPITFIDNSSDLDGHVVSWTWDFGDGNTSTLRHPTHPGYAVSGTYTVRLTIVDDRGAVNTTIRHVSIANAMPIAKWTLDTFGQPLLVNTSVLFLGGGSFDPDGNPILDWKWSMGDGSAQKGGENVTHQFQRSGRYIVGLTVNDGTRSSERVNGVSHKQVNVTPNHDVKFVISAKLPDNTPAPITAAPYTVDVRIGGTEVTLKNPVGNVMEITADADLWVHGDLATVTIGASFLSSGNSQVVTMRDGFPVVYLNFTLRMAVFAEIWPTPGDETSLLAILGANNSYGSDPLYVSMFEEPHGTGRMYYADQSPAANHRVDIEARWVPLLQLSNARNSTEPILPNWCRVASATTAANGSFTWAFDGQSQCYLNGAVTGGIYPVGRWEVRARPQVPVAENRLSAMRAFYVDPTGGVLLGASMGLA